MSNQQHTTDEIFAPREPTAEEQPLCFIDIHIYEQEQTLEDPSSVESHLESEPAAPDESQHQSARSAPAPHRRRRTIALGVGSMCLSVVSALLIFSLLPLLTPDTNITIVPSTRQLRTTATITVTTRAATGALVQGRALAAITMDQARTVPTTGKGHQDAKAAHGDITFYNAATYQQTVVAGTLLTGADGLQVVTDQDASIPAANYPTFGQQSVPAHAVITGPAGNIQTSDIYGPCCRLNISAVSSAFSGGQQARDYQTVTQQDINTIVSSLKTSLNQSVQAALQTQVQSDETLITPLPCQQRITPDHQPGEEAAQVHITVSETCTGTTYTTQAYQNRIVQIANHQAGDGYNPIGQVQSTITDVLSRAHNETELHVTIAQSYAYQVSQLQQQQLKTLIAGKSKAQATSMLLHTPGLQSVSVSSATIPTDTKHIRVIVVYVG